MIIEQSATDRLKALETEAAPLRDREAEIAAGIAKVDAELDAAIPADADLDAEVVARKARLSKKADLELERGMVAERLGHLGALIADAKVEALSAEREQWRAGLMEAARALTPSAEKLADDLGILANQLSMGRSSGHSSGIEVQRAIREMVGPLYKNILVLIGRLR